MILRGAGRDCPGLAWQVVLYELVKVHAALLARGVDAHEDLGSPGTGIGPVPIQDLAEFCELSQRPLAYVVVVLDVVHDESEQAVFFPLQPLYVPQAILVLIVFGYEAPYPVFEALHGPVGSVPPGGDGVLEDAVPSMKNRLNSLLPFFSAVRYMSRK